MMPKELKTCAWLTKSPNNSVVEFISLEILNPIRELEALNFKWVCVNVIR